MDRTIIFVGIVIIIILGIILWGVEVYYRRKLLEYFCHRFKEERKRSIKRINNEPKTKEDEKNNIILNSRAVAFSDAAEIVKEEING